MNRHASPYELHDRVRRNSRRAFLCDGLALGAAALATLSHSQALGAGALAGLHHPARAKRVIHLQMLGGPSQLDLFDHKPALSARHVQDVPTELYAGERLAFVRGTKKFLGTAYKFSQHGKSGAEVSELLPKIAEIADELTFIKSMRTDQFNHGPAWNVMNTGYPQAGKPTLGAWLNYGLGNAQNELPDYVVLVPGMRNSGGKGMWGAGFLPAQHQGVELRTTGEAVPFIANPQGIDGAARRDTIEAVAELDRERLAEFADPEIAGSIAAYELAARMQMSVPALMDFADESPETLALYGLPGAKSAYAQSCLVARRLIERGVRFVQICYEGETMRAIWDSHGDTRRASLEVGLPMLCQNVDQPTAGLILDLKRRGLLDDTLVVWGGEFGRTPMNEDRPFAEKGYTGRDHWPHAGTIFLAGAGLKPGFTLGKTDELGFHVVENPVHIHDLNATMLYLLGIDHKRLTYRFQGRDFRLTDVHGVVVDKLLA